MHIKEETLSHQLEPRLNSETSEQQLQLFVLATGNY